MKYPPRVGMFGIEHDAYWPQFVGLKQRLEGYLQFACERLQRPGIELVNLGLVDNPARAVDVGYRFRSWDVDVPFLYVITYALSSTIGMVEARLILSAVGVGHIADKSRNRERCCGERSCKSADRVTALACHRGAMRAG